MRFTSALAVADHRQGDHARRGPTRGGWLRAAVADRGASSCVEDRLVQRRADAAASPLSVDQVGYAAPRCGSESGPTQLLGAHQARRPVVGRVLERIAIAAETLRLTAQK